MLKGMGSGGRLGANSAPVNYHLCDFGQLPNLSVP